MNKRIEICETKRINNKNPIDYDIWSPFGSNLFAQSRKFVLGREMKEIQNGSAFATDGTVEGIPYGLVDRVVDHIQSGDCDQRIWRTTQFGRKVKFLVIDHVNTNFNIKLY